MNRYKEGPSLDELTEDQRTEIRVSEAVEIRRMRNDALEKLLNTFDGLLRYREVEVGNKICETNEAKAFVAVPYSHLRALLQCARGMLLDFRDLGL